MIWGCKGHSDLVGVVVDRARTRGRLGAAAHPHEGGEAEGQVDVLVGEEALVEGAADGGAEDRDPVFAVGGCGPGELQVAVGVVLHAAKQCGPVLRQGREKERESVCVCV